jgi:large subunit ribosomal protein L29
MALLKTSELRGMTPEARAEKLREIRDELMHERGLGAMGGAPASPGKIKALRKNIARILTIQREYEISLENKTEASE